MLLKPIAQAISDGVPYKNPALNENEVDDANNVDDREMTERTLNDVFIVTNTGLEYLKRELEVLVKKAKRIGVQPLELKVLGTEKRTVPVKSAGGTTERVTQDVFKIQIVGKSPIIDGYEFIASIEHAEGGNIINMCPSSNVKSLPAEYRTANTSCDFCHTKRDRLNTFVLREISTGKLMKVGRSCLKNFLPGKNPKAIIDYAVILSNMLRAAIGAEGMEDYNDRDGMGGGGRYNRYYPADYYLFFVCMSYLMEGKFISKKAARADENNSLQATADDAWFLANLRDVDDKTGEIRATIERLRPKADALLGELKAWIDVKDWDAEIEKNQDTNPGLSQYFHNLKTVAQSTTIAKKNSNLHASVLASFLREKYEAEKKVKQAETNKTHTYIGAEGEKVTFTAKLVRAREFPGDYGTTFMYAFEDATGNDIVWFASRDQSLEDGQTYTMKATVKKQQLSKFTGGPQTIVTRAKVISTDP